MPNETPLGAVAEPPTACRNCGAERLGPFCHSCGQAFLDGRLTLRRLGRELVRRLFDLERGFLLTFRRMLTAPGEVIRDYIEGRRRRHVNPFTYLFLGTALSILTFSLLRQARALGELRERIEASVEPLGFTPEQLERYTDIQLALTEQTTAVALILCLPFILLVRLFFPKSGLNLAEAAVFSLYLFAQVFYLDALTEVLFMRVGLTGQTWINVALFTGVGAWTGWSFFGHRISAAIRVVAAFGLAYLSFTIAFFVALLFYVKTFV